MDCLVPISLSQPQPSPSTTHFTLTLTGSSRAVQISPETPPPTHHHNTDITATAAADESDTTIAGAAATTTTTDKFSCIATRPLRTPGLCKVLMVDDSKINVRIMRKLVQQASAVCFLPPPPAPSTGSTGENEGTATDLDRTPQKRQYTDRSSAYMAVESPCEDHHVSAEEVRFDYSEADDGRVAVQKVRAAGEQGVPFDIVFMDNIMLFMHGPEAAQLMRAAGFPGLIVGVTGNVMADDVNEYIHSGADYVLGKPVNFEDLKLLMQKLQP